MTFFIISIQRFHELSTAYYKYVLFITFVGMNCIFFEHALHAHLLPLSFTRPVSQFRFGILTIREKWAHSLKGAEFSDLSESYLSEKYPLNQGEDNYWIYAGLCPDDSLIASLKKLQVNEGYSYKGKIILARSKTSDFTALKTSEHDAELLWIENLSDLFSKNDKAIQADFTMLTAGRTSQPISDSNRVINSSDIFLEEGAKVECAVLNAGSGPIYIAKDAEVMEGSLVRGPFALCEGSQLKMAAKIYGATTIGPHSKVGGEVNNAVIFGYSNKAHDGFLGNSVIGEWCNLGADTNNSNLKNNYAEVKLWSYTGKNFKRTGLQFCGLIMADHSKCGINTMFNTGTVVGVACNIFGSGFPRNFVPDFSWGGAQGFEVYAIAKVFEVAAKAYERREVPFTEADKNILMKVFELTNEYRTY